MNTPVIFEAPAPEQFGIKSEVATQIKAQFEPMLNKMSELEEKRNAIIDAANNEISPEIVKQAKELRLEYVSTRTGTAKIHKEQKAYYLQMGRFVDAWKNVQLTASQGAEQTLENIEKHYERLEEERREKLRADRWNQLQPYKEEEPAGLADMENDVFTAYLEISKRNHQERIEAEQRAEEERQRQVLADKREREILHLRNFWPEDLPSLGGITAEQFAALVHGCEAREKEYIANQERIAREREELEKKEAAARAEVEKARKEREEAECAAKEREAKLEAEREAERRKDQEQREAERKKAEAERMAAIKKAQEAERKRIEEERAEMQRAEDEKLAKEAKERAARSDADKLREMAAHRPEWPQLESEGAEWILKEYAKLLEKAQGWVNSQIESKL